MRLWMCILTQLLACPVLFAAPARIALLHSSHDKTVLPGDYDSSHRHALASIRALGFTCDPI